VNEKRKHPRFGIASMAEIYFPDSDEPMEAFISSISRGGIGIYSPHKIDIGQNLDIKISFLQTNGNEEVSEIIPGKVVWVKGLHDSFVVGVAFATLDNLRHSKLLSYIEAAAQGTA
jgi:Tfp pilus assembly protein PilZ